MTRSNDGRADPTGRVADWHHGHCLPKLPMPGRFTAIIAARYVSYLSTGLTIPNAICFCPRCAIHAYFTDTPTRANLGCGFGSGRLAHFHHLGLAVDLTSDWAKLLMVLSSMPHGNIWNAQWGAARLGLLQSLMVFSYTASKPSHCLPPMPPAPPLPAPLHALFCTSATQGRQAHDQTDASRWASL